MGQLTSAQLQRHVKTLAFQETFLQYVISILSF